MTDMSDVGKADRVVMPAPKPPDSFTAEQGKDAVVNTGGADQVLIEEREAQIEACRAVSVALQKQVKELEANCNIFKAEKQELYVRNERFLDKIMELKCELTEVKRMTGFKEPKNA